MFRTPLARQRGEKDGLATSTQAQEHMDERRRIGLREVRALKPGETAWDSAVPGFGVRRQSGDAVAYVLKSRTSEGNGGPPTPTMRVRSLPSRGNNTK